MPAAPKSRRQRPEDALQSAVVAYLRVALPSEAVVWATPNAAVRRQGGRAANAVPGLLEGIPDLFVLHAGRLVGIELKAPPKRLPSGKLSAAKPRLSEAQEHTLPRLARAGAAILVCRSIEDVRDGLHRLGIPLRGVMAVRG